MTSRITAAQLIRNRAGGAAVLAEPAEPRIVVTDMP